MMNHWTDWIIPVILAVGAPALVLICMWPLVRKISGAKPIVRFLLALVSFGLLIAVVIFFLDNFWAKLVEVSAVSASVITAILLLLVDAHKTPAAKNNGKIGFLGKVMSSEAVAAIGVVAAALGLGVLFRG